MVKSALTIEELPNSILKNFYQYWLRMKGSRSMPSRSNLNPADITPLLPNIVLVDVEQDPRRYRVRLLGTETVKVLGEDCTGRYLDDLTMLGSIVKKRYEWLVVEKKPYFYRGNMKNADKPYIEYMGVAMPLSSNGVDVDILMVGIHYQYTEGRQEILPPYNPEDLGIYPLEG